MMKTCPGPRAVTEETEMAKTVKLSQTMEEALHYLGRGIYRAHLEAASRTLTALESRGMIRWSTEAELGAVGERRVHDTTRLWTVTVAGWAFLKAEYDMDRPADAGRMSLDAALVEAYETWEEPRGDWGIAVIHTPRIPAGEPEPVPADPEREAERRDLFSLVREVNQPGSPYLLDDPDQPVPYRLADPVDVADDFYRDPDGWRAQESGSGAGARPGQDRAVYAEAARITGEKDAAVLRSVPGTPNGLHGRVSPPPGDASTVADLQGQAFVCSVCRWSFSSAAAWSRHTTSHLQNRGSKDMDR